MAADRATHEIISNGLCDLDTDDPVLPMFLILNVIASGAD